MIKINECAFCMTDHCFHEEMFALFSVFGRIAEAKGTPA